MRISRMCWSTPGRTTTTNCTRSFLPSLASAARTIGNVIIAADEAMEAHRPDALLVLGDTNSCLAAIAAKRRQIPIFHMEAGNRCFDFRVPEEINRRIVDHTADINLTYSQIARTYLLREGFPSDQVIVTGSPMREVLTHYRAGIQASEVLNRLGLSPGRYFIVSAHREENVDSPERLRKLINILMILATRYQEPVIVSTHPRTRKRIDALGVSCPVNVHFEKPFGFLDYVKLQCEARAGASVQFQTRGMRPRSNGRAPRRRRRTTSSDRRWCGREIRSGSRSLNRRPRRRRSLGLASARARRSSPPCSTRCRAIAWFSRSPRSGRW